MANILAAPLPADLPTDWTQGQTVAPNGADAGLPPQHGYNYLMEQVNAAQSASNEIDGAVSSHLEDKDNPHEVTAEQVGADPAGSAASVQGNLDVHTNNKENPHGVTATQTGALPLSGGTMTGPITLAADPAAAMQPVTKQYFDQAIGDIGSALDAINGEVI